jgi:hypothetical protein
MDGFMSLGCKTFTVVHARWAAGAGKLRKTVAGIGHVVWDEDGSACRIYIPARLQHDVLASVVESLSDYVGAALEFTSAETLALIMTRPETLESVPSDCIAVELSKWNTGIGWYDEGRLLREDEVEVAWQHIIDQIGSDRVRWHTYAPEVVGFG